MDKHWKDVKIGDIIELDFGEYKEYYKLCEGNFEMPRTEDIGCFYGKYFKYLGKNTNKTIIFTNLDLVVGYEVLDYEYKIIDKSPENLYK